MVFSEIIIVLALIALLLLILAPVIYIFNREKADEKETQEGEKKPDAGDE